MPVTGGEIDNGFSFDFKSQTFEFEVRIESMESIESIESIENIKSIEIESSFIYHFLKPQNCDK